MSQNYPRSFGLKLFATAVYLINRTISSATLDKKTPAELWYGHKPNLETIRVFGCDAHVHIPKEIRGNKLNARSKKMIHVGYTSNGYRLWDFEDQKVITARNVIFDESSLDKSSDKRMTMDLTSSNVPHTDNHHDIFMDSVGQDKHKHKVVQNEAMQPQDMTEGNVDNIKVTSRGRKIVPPARFNCFIHW